MIRLLVPALVVFTVIGRINTNTIEELAQFDSITDEYIRILNSAQDSWTSGHNFPPGVKFEDLKSLVYTSRRKAENNPARKEVKTVDKKTIPVSFDSRVRWPHCKSIKKIQNQGNCQSCGAIAAATVISDRLCIATNGTFNTDLSIQHFLSCTPYNYGCDGTDSCNCLDYFVKNGVPTGGAYHSDEGCQPYLVKPCKQFNDSNSHLTPCWKTPKAKTAPCQKTCYNQKYNHTFQDDLHFGISYYTLENNVTQIQADILENGPVLADFWLMCDFYSYKRGVYEPKTKKICGFYVLRIIGWGVENDKEYWLAANMWDKDWGDNGLVKFRKGNNTLSIENNVLTVYV